MSEETLFTAARRVVRFFNIDMNAGGLITVDTQAAIETLQRHVEYERRRQTIKPPEDLSEPTMRN